MKKIFWYLILILIHLPAFSQNAEIDSLENLLANHKKTDTVKIDLLNDIAGISLSIDPDKALQYAIQADSLSDVAGFKKGKAESLQLIGSYYYTKQDYSQALVKYQQALEICKAIDDKTQIASINNHTGNIHLMQGNYLKSLEYYEKALKGFEEIGDKTGISGIRNNFANIYYMQGDYPRALENMQKALKVFEELKNKTGISGSYNNIGVVYDEQGKYTEALEYYEKALEIRKELNDKYGISDTYTNMGNIYYTRDDFQKALEYFQKSLEINQELSYKTGIAISYLNMGIIYLAQEDYAKSLVFFQNSMELAREIGSQEIITTNNIEFCNACFGLKNYSLAIQYGEKGYHSAVESGERDNIKKAADILAKCYAATGNFKKAYQYHIAFKTQSDSLFNESNIKKITTLENQYKFDKEKQVLAAEQAKKDALQEAALKRQKVVRNSFMIGFIFMIGFALVIFRSLAQIRKANRALASQKAEIQTQTEKISEQYERLEKLDKFKESLTHALVHDLKNPLSQIMDNTNSQSTRHAAGKMLRLVLNMLDVEKYEAAEFNLNKELHSLSEILEEVRNGLGTSLREKNLKLKMLFNDYAVMADKELMVRVFDNLLANAIRFSPQNSSIDVWAERAGDGHISISLKNYGQPIPEEQLPFIFDKYRQFGKNDSSSNPSTGLGLTFCKMAIEAHGQKISVKNEADGVVFTLGICGNVPDTEQYKPDNNSSDSNDMTLTLEEKALLLPFFEKLKNTGIHQISDILQVLGEIPEDSENITALKQQIRDAAFASNGELYQQILEMEK